MEKEIDFKERLKKAIQNVSDEWNNLSKEEFDEMIQNQIDNPKTKELIHLFELCPLYI